MVKRLLLLPALLTCCLFAAECVVIVSPDAIPAEKTAGRELRKFLARLSGKSRDEVHICIANDVVVLQM